MKTTKQQGNLLPREFQAGTRNGRGKSVREIFGNSPAMTKRTLKTWAKEIDVDPATLGRLLRAAGHELKPKKLWPARAIAAAMGNDLRVARTREVRARADLLELQVRERKADLVPVETIAQVIAKILRDLRGPLDAMPREIAARCNPADPELAGRVIRESVSRIQQNADDAAALP